MIVDKSILRVAIKSLLKKDSNLRVQGIGEGVSLLDVMDNAVFLEQVEACCSWVEKDSKSTRTKVAGKYSSLGEIKHMVEHFYQNQNPDLKGTDEEHLYISRGAVLVAAEILNYDFSYRKIVRSTQIYSHIGAGSLHAGVKKEPSNIIDLFRFFIDNSEHVDDAYKNTAFSPKIGLGLLHKIVSNEGGLDLLSGKQKYHYDVFIKPLFNDVFCQNSVVSHNDEDLENNGMTTCGNPIELDNLLDCYKDDDFTCLSCC